MLSISHRAQKKTREIRQELEEVCPKQWMINDVRHDWAVHWDDIDQTRLNPNDTKIYCFACISLVPPRISLSLFATYLVDSPLSITDVQLWARCSTTEISSSYSLFWNTWFNILSSTCSSFSSYLNCFKSRRTLSYTMLGTDFCSKSSKYSVMDLGWVTRTYLNALTFYLISYRLIDHSRVIFILRLIVVSVSEAINCPHELEWSNQENRWALAGETLLCRAKFWPSNLYLGYTGGSILFMHL
jgi:hypothetical protein